MPEMRFRIRWPDGTPETCYSPSLVIKDYFAVGADYALPEFVARSRTAGNAVVIEDDHSGAISSAPDVTLASVVPERVIHGQRLGVVHVQSGPCDPALVERP